MAVERGTTRVVSGPALARTYSSPSHADPWEAVEEYQRVLDYAARRPDAGSTAIASHFDLPRGRVRPWLDGTMPDAARGVQTAEELGWIDVDVAGDIFRGLNVFCSWVYSGGSILRDTWMPYFAVDDDADHVILEAAGELAGVEVDFTRSADESRGRELRPTRNGSLLGRVLAVLGAPRGGKANRADVNLPGYLASATTTVRRQFVQVYLHNRAQEHGDSDVLHFREGRPNGYLKEVASLIRKETGEAVSISERNVILSAEAARAVRVWPPLPGLG